MQTLRSFPTAARWLVLLATAACVLVIGIRRPLYDWDIIGYVASAYQLDGHSGQDLLGRTFKDIRSDVDAETFRTLTEGGDQRAVRDYRRTVASDPVALSQQIPFYSIRVIYVGLIRAVGRLGPSYSEASTLVSAVSGALAVLVLGRILVVAGVHVALLPLVALASGFAELARSSAPDALELFFALLCALALLKGSAMSLVFAAVLPATRTDFLLVSLLVLCVEFVRGRKVPALISMAAASVVYVVVNKSSGNYGWTTLITLSEVSLLAYPAELTHGPSVPEYVKIYAFGLFNFVSSIQFMIYLLAAYPLYFQLKKNGARLSLGFGKFLLKMGRRDGGLVALYFVPVLYAVGHIVLFPHYEPRYFVFSVTLVSVWILSRARSQVFRRPSQTRKVETAAQAEGVDVGLGAAGVGPRMRTRPVREPTPTA